MSTRKRDKSPSRKSVGGSRKLRWRSSHTSVSSHPRVTSSWILNFFLMAATFQVTLWIVMAYILQGPETQAPSSHVIQETTQNPLNNSFPIALGTPTVQREGKSDYFRQTQAPSSHVIQETTQNPLNHSFPIALGIPSVKREGKPDYFRQTQASSSHIIQETTQNPLKNTIPIALDTPSVQREGEPDYFRQTQAPSSNVIQETTTKKPFKNTFPIAFGIPTVQREGRPDYFRRTILSLTQHGVPLGSIFVLYGGTSKENHTVLQNTKMELEGNAADGDSEPHSFHTVPRDPQDVSIDYELPAHASERVRDAHMDKPEQKRWRIQEAHDFMWLTQYMLCNTDAPYVAFHQDDALIENLERNFGNWSNIFSLLSTKEDKNGGNHSILSLYHDRYEIVGVKNKPPKHPVCGLNVFCGMVSLVFQRDTLQHIAQQHFLCRGARSFPPFPFTTT
jgi:hypothetical protein